MSERTPTEEAQYLIEVWNEAGWPHTTGFGERLVRLLRALLAECESQKAEIERLQKQVARWEAKEVARASCCVENEQRADAAEAALQSIAVSTCCFGCGEAARVARAALCRPDPKKGDRPWGLSENVKIVKEGESR